jgi:hypothetical protein
MTIFYDFGQFVESTAKFTIKHIGVVVYTANDFGDSILHDEVIPLFADVVNTANDIGETLVHDSFEPLATEVGNAVGNSLNDGLNAANKLSENIIHGAIEPVFAIVKAAYSDVESFTVAVTYEF